MKIKITEKGDALIAAAVIIACLLLWLVFRPGADGSVAVIAVDGKEYARIDLSQVSEPYMITIDGEIPVTIAVERGKIGFASSGCKEQICVGAGMISKKGQSAVCVPARVSITVEGGAADAVTG